MTRGRVLVAMLAMLGLPLALAGFGAFSYHRVNRDTHAIISGGFQRGYVLHVPPTYDGRRPTPLVISMHGAGLWGAAQRDISQWDRVADREGFIVVYPTALKRGVRVWSSANVRNVSRDVVFIGDLIDTLSARYNIDASRIYANGLSNGGGMSFVLSCTMPRRIAAVGLVASAQTLPWRWCPDTSAVPMIAIHGTRDKYTRYTGGQSWIGPNIFPGIPGWVRNWAQRNGCAATAADSRVAGDVTKREYTGCRAPVVFYTIEDGGHTWPGGAAMPEWFVGKTSHSIDASSVMWEFFRHHGRSVEQPQDDRHDMHD